jgi:gliding motility-associated-like protein
LKKSDNIEEIFQEAFKGYEADAGANTWTNIKGQLSGAEAAAGVGAQGAAASSSIASWLTTAIIVVTIGGLAVGGYYVFKQKEEKQKSVEIEKTEAIESPIIKDEVKPGVIEEPHVEKNNTSQTSEFSNESKVNQITRAPQASEPKVKQPTDLKSTRGPLAMDSVEKSQNNEQISKNQATVGPNLKQPSNHQEQSKIKNETSDTQVTSENEVIQQVEEEKAEKSAQPSEATVKQKPGDDHQDAHVVVCPEVVMPNAFSPNGDGTNDKYLITRSETQEVEVQIFDRTNKMIKSWKGIYGSWDGKMPDGTPAPEGSYVYRLIFTTKSKDCKPKGGFLLLSREP